MTMIKISVVLGTVTLAAMTSARLTGTAGPVILPPFQPAMVTAGGPAFTLYVGGTGMVSGSVVQWNGTALPTTLFKPDTLQVQVSANLIAQPGTFNITVSNPDGSVSPPAAFPVVSSPVILPPFQPAMVTAGGPAFTLYVGGTGMVSGSVAQWNGTALPTTLFKPDTLQVQVSANLIAQPGTFNITVSNPDGSVSPPAAFPVVPGPSWTPLTYSAPFGASSAILLTDGTVMVQQIGGANWWKLTPDSSDSYVNGTWSQLASLPSGYSPLYYASAVLSDGRVVVIGGEYNLDVQDWVNLGAVYDPKSNTWAGLAAPSGWNQIGDAQSTVLPDGKFLLADPFDTRIAKLDPGSLTWTNLSSAGKADPNDEEGWTLLPDGTVLTVDVVDALNSERYLPSSDSWVTAGNTIEQLEDQTSEEIGPAVLRPDGTVFATGATGHNSIYTVSTGTWTAGPDFPDLTGEGQLDIADGPAALLPSGAVLVATSNGVSRLPTHFFEFDGTHLNMVPAPPDAPYDSSFEWRLLLLPNGQVLATDGSSDVEVYTSAGTFDDTWRPTITSAPTTMTAGATYTISGTQFNGLSQAVAYGDDYQGATNYPLVRFTDQVTGDVYYGRTHDHSSMGVATGSAQVSTKVDVPSSLLAGIFDMTVIANGIPSHPQPVAILSSH